MRPWSHLPRTWKPAPRKLPRRYGSSPRRTSRGTHPSDILDSASSIQEDRAAMAPPSRPPSIELVVFDLDGVLAALDRERRLALLAEMTGKAPAFLHQAIWASDFER